MFAETQADVVHVVVHATTPLHQYGIHTPELPRLVVDMLGALGQNLREITQPMPGRGSGARCRAACSA